MSHFPLRSGAARSAGALALLLTLGGCLYSFHGGGLPAHLKTVAVLPFDNRTGEPELTQELYAVLQDGVPGRLGLRQAGEASADAIVRGEITSYQSNIPLSYQATTAQTQGTVDVTRRRVQITINVEIYDARLDKPLWRQNGLTVDGEYDTQGGSEADGRKAAEAKIVTQVVEGAQSQW